MNFCCYIGNDCRYNLWQHWWLSANFMVSYYYSKQYTYTSDIKFFCLVFVVLSVVLQCWRGGLYMLEVGTLILVNMTLISGVTWHLLCVLFTNVIDLVLQIDVGMYVALCYRTRINETIRILAWTSRSNTRPCQSDHSTVSKQKFEFFKTLLFQS